MIKKLFLWVIILSSACVLAESSPYKPISSAWVLHSSDKTDNGGGLVLVGVTHMVGEHSNSQLTDIERIYHAFSPTLVLTEGGVWPVKDNKYAAVNCCGEMGFITYLASLDGVKVDTWEGCPEHEAAYLLSQFTMEELKVFYALRYVPQLMTHSEQFAEDQLNAILRQKGGIEAEFKLSSPPYSTHELNQWLSNTMAAELSWMDFQVFEETIQLDGLNQLVEIRQAVNELRVQAGAEKLNKYVAEDYRVLMIVGKDHFRGIMALIQ